MRGIEEAADAAGLTFDIMMKNAGESIAMEIIHRLGSVSEKRVVILAGSGNNGGDGLVVGDHLADSGAQVSVYLTKQRDDSDENLSRLKAREILIAVYGSDQRARVLKNMLLSADIVVDAILGTGFSLPLSGDAKEVLSKSKKILEKREDTPFIIAVDCPSGLDCDSGEIAEDALSAHLTVTLAAAKPGLLTFPGAEYVGELVVGDIGIPAKQKELSKIKLTMPDHETIKNMLPHRSMDSHKGTFGRVLIVAGSINYPGAAGLSALAAYRIGAGLVTLAVPAIIQPLIAPLLPEATWILLPHEMGVLNENGGQLLIDEFENSQALLIGPGFGQEEVTKDFISTLLGSLSHSQKPQFGFLLQDTGVDEKANEIPPCVVDADALKLLVDIENWTTLLPPDTVLTPHPGEMAVMTGISTRDIQADRIKVAAKWAKKWGHIVVLKGAFTVVASPDGNTSVIPFASASLARAGTGDVLAGAIAGLRAQGVPGYQAAVLGSYLHALAGQYVSDSLGTEISVLAGEVADALATVLADVIS
jgi:NAD(P)H-hydrate epimerase